MRGECVCVCVCVRERERERERMGQREIDRKDGAKENLVDDRVFVTFFVQKNPIQETIEFLSTYRGWDRVFKLE